MIKTVAFLPIRKGSKSIPLKNFKLMAGKPLFAWVADEIVATKKIDMLVISTDYPDIKKTYPKLFSSPKVMIFDRSPESATDTASTESAMFDFLDKTDIKFDEFILVQATIPFSVSLDFDKAIKKFRSSKADSLLTLVAQKKFFWEKKRNPEFVVPINYDPQHRPRRQEIDFQYFENGAFYISTKKALLKSRCRISGKITYYVMESKALDIDEPDDWVLAEKLLLERDSRK
jgi:CMP-N-acetylneuraminic acid synthetase